MLWGLQFSLLGPMLALLLVTLFHADPGQLAWVLAVYNASGFAWALVIPAWSDRRRRYLPVMAACAVLTILLVVALSFGGSLWVAAAALVVLGGPAGVGMSMLFAHMKSVGSSRQQVMNVRAMVSFAWVAGPPLATFVLRSFGDRALLWTIAGIGVLTLSTVVALVRQQTQARAPLTDPDATPVADVPMSRLSVSIISIAFVLLAATNSAAVSTMSLFVTRQLHLSLTWSGIALAVAAGLEVPSLLFLGRLSARVGSLPLMLSGCLAGLVFYLAMLVVHGPVLLLGLQVLNAWFVATLSGVGLTLFQEVIPRPGLAAGLYMNTRRVGAILAGPVIALAGTSMGYSAIYVASCVLTAVGLLAIWGVARHTSRPSPV